MRRRTPKAMVLRVLPVAVACAATLAACGSSSSPATQSAPASTVTRTVTRSASATSSQSATSSTTATQTSSSTSMSTGGPATSVAECVASDLALRSLGGSAATGHALLGFGLRNTSDHACRTGGYPGVQFLDAAGRDLPTKPDHTTDDFFGHTVLRVLTVAPGQTVSFRLGVTDVSTGDSSAGCQSAKGLQVIAPNDTATLHLARDIFECNGDVTVSPLQAGTAALH